MQHPDHDELLNAAMAFILEWGENFGKPILERMKRKFPDLTETEILSFEEKAKKIKFLAFNLIEKAYHEKISTSQVWREIHDAFPGLSEDNRSHLQTQGMYYAWHG